MLERGVLRDLVGHGLFVRQTRDIHGHLVQLADRRILHKLVQAVGLGALHAAVCHKALRKRGDLAVGDDAALLRKLVQLGIERGGHGGGLGDHHAVIVHKLVDTLVPLHHRRADKHALLGFRMIEIRGAVDVVGLDHKERQCACQQHGDRHDHMERGKAHVLDHAKIREREAERQQRQARHDIAVAVERRNQRDKDKIYNARNDNKPSLARQLFLKAEAHHQIRHDRAQKRQPEQPQLTEEQLLGEDLHIADELVTQIGDDGDQVDLHFERAKAPVAAEDIGDDIRIHHHCKAHADGGGDDIDDKRLDVALPDGKNQINQPDQSGAQNEIVLREHAADHRDEHKQIVRHDRPFLIVVDPQGEIQKRQHPKGERGIHAQIDRCRHARQAEGIPSGADERKKRIAADALADQIEHDQRTGHHHHIDTERQPAVELLRKERAHGMHQRIVERRMARVDHLVLVDVPIVKAVFACGEIFIKIRGGIPLGIHAELLGGIGEVIGEQLVLMIALLCRHIKEAERKACDDQYRKHNTGCFFTQLHAPSPYCSSL